MSEDNSDQINIINDEAALAEVDSFLAEIDPSFLKDLSEIKIENSDVNLSLIDESVLAIQRKLTLKEKFIQIVDYKYNLKKVILFWLAITTSLGLIYGGFHPEIWDKKSSLFLTSYAALNVPVENYDLKKDTQYFFENPRITQNIVVLKKMLVNLKNNTDSNVKTNSMLAFEISIEGITNEVVVEIKDRESEFIDLAARSAEDFSYNELSSAQGKKQLAEKILIVYNENLTKGKARKVLYSSFILKN